MSAAEVFHTHLGRCPQCREGAGVLCREARDLFERAKDEILKGAVGRSRNNDAELALQLWRELAGSYRTEILRQRLILQHLAVLPDAERPDEEIAARETLIGVLERRVLVVDARAEVCAAASGSGSLSWTVQ